MRMAGAINRPMPDPFDGLSLAASRDDEIADRQPFDGNLTFGREDSHASDETRGRDDDEAVARVVQILFQGGMIHGPRARQIKRRAATADRVAAVDGVAASAAAVTAAAASGPGAATATAAEAAIAGPPRLLPAAPPA
jgi:hypothetical protein